MATVGPNDPDDFLVAVDRLLMAAAERGERIEDVAATMNAAWKQVSEQNGIDGYPVLIKQGDDWVVDVKGWSKDSDGPR